MQQLGASKFTERKAAHKKLRGYSLFARSEIEAAASSDDPEVRDRAMDILREIDRGAPLLELEAALNRFVRDRKLAADPRAFSAVIDVLPLGAGTHFEWTVKEALRSVVTPAHRGSLAELILGKRDADSHDFVRESAMMAWGRADPERERTEVFDHVLGGKVVDLDLKLVAAVALVDQKHASAFPLLFDLLESTDSTIRLVSGHVLEKVTDRKAAFDADAEVETRKKQVTAWRKWFEDLGGVKNGGGLFRQELDRLQPEDRLTGFVLSVSVSGLIVLDLQGKELWQQIAEPYDGQGLPNGRILVTERSDGKIYTTNRAGERKMLVEGLSSPTDAELLPGGNLLVLEGGTNRVVEFNGKGEEVWTVGRLDNAYDVDPPCQRQHAGRGFGQQSSRRVRPEG